MADEQTRAPVWLAQKNIRLSFLDPMVEMQLFEEGKRPGAAQWRKATRQGMIYEGCGILTKR